MRPQNIAISWFLSLREFGDGRTVTDVRGIQTPLHHKQK